MNKKRIVLKNAAYMTGTQALSYLSPLLLVPYLINTIGFDRYGKLMFVSSIGILYKVLADYSFGIISTRQIALDPLDRKRVSSILGGTIFYKLLVALIFVAILVILGLIGSLADYSSVFLYSFPLFFFESLIPIYFYQGMERLKKFSLALALSKLASLIAVFVFIQNPEDFLLVPLIQSIGFFGALLFMFYDIVADNYFKFSDLSLTNLKNETKNGLLVFLSNISIVFYNSGLTIILRYFTGDSAVGIYVSGGKIISACKGMIRPVAQSLFPYFVRLGSDSSKIPLFKQLNILGLIVSIMGIVFAISLMILAEDILFFIRDKEDLERSANVLRILAFTPVLVALSNIYAVQGLYALKQERIVLLLTTTVAITALFLALIIIPVYQERGASFTVLFSEILMVLFSYISFNQFKNKYKVT
ncbi:oligosaccharide flippase family protein [Schleiferiaceae bacterium]|nr:oligosaccharide flippase family protein [Schleiferiaceae bacterium]